MSSLLLLFSKYGKKKSVSSGPVTLFYDTFTDVDGTLLASHTPDIRPNATSWFLGSATGFAISSNTAAVISPNTSGLSLFDMGTPNCTITAIFRYSNLTSGQQHILYIYGRWSNSSNYWNIQAGQSGSGLIFRIAEVSGSSTIRASGDASGLAINTDYPISVTFNGSVITATLNGVTISYGSATSNSTITNFGIRYLSSAASFQSIDNFMVTSL